MLGLRRHLKTIRSIAVPCLTQGSPRPYRPDLSDATFFRRLAPGVSGLRAARECFDKGDRGRAQSLVVEHFRQRRSPKFFVDSERIAELIAIIERTHPSWKAAALARALAETEQGLDIFATRAAPLGHAFSFHDLKPGPGGDALYVKMPHRFAYLPRLALCALYGAPTLEALHRTLASWMQEADGAGNEPAHSSNLVVTYRILALSWTLAFLHGLAHKQPDTAAHTEFEILKVLSTDAHFLTSRIGQSVPNNHLLADGFIGWYLGLLYPEFAGMTESAARGTEIWLREFKRQIYEDGTVFEHCTHYLELDSEMAVAYVLLARRNGLDIPSWAVERVGRMLAFLTAIGGPDSHSPHIGDATQELLFPLDTGTGAVSGAMRELYRAMVRADAIPARTDDLSVERAFWLLGGALASAAPVEPAGARLDAFPCGGFYVFHDEDPGTRLILRTGPAPDLPIAIGHMHADLMSIYLTVRGMPVVIDPGTYTYRGPARNWPNDTPAWRHHFLSPDAHNGPTIAGADPLGPVRTDFRSGEPATRIVERRAATGARLALVEAEMVGRSPYAGHRRGVVHIVGEYWLIYDVLPRNLDPRLMTLSLQFTPEARVKPSSGAVRVTVGAQVLEIPCAESLRVKEVVAGRAIPTGGWVAPRYGQLVPAPQVRFSVVDTAPPTAFALYPATEDGNEFRLSHWRLAAPAFGFRLACGTIEDRVVINPFPADEASAADGPVFRGAVAWIRFANSTPIAVRWIDGQALAWPTVGLDIRAETTMPGLEIQASPGGPTVVSGPPERVHINWP